MINGTVFNNYKKTYDWVFHINLPNESKTIFNPSFYQINRHYITEILL